MNKKFTTSLLLTTTIGALSYLGYNSIVSHKSPAEIIQTHHQVDLIAENTGHKELDMDLNNIDPIDAFVEPALAIQETTPNVTKLAQFTPQNDVEDSTETLAEGEMVQVLGTPEPVVLKKIAETEKKAPEPLKKEITLSKKEKLDKFAKNMEGLQKQAEDEWSKMSSEEREEAEQQVEVFQHNFQEEIERLSQLSPEEVEREKHEAMVKLERENPEAYQAVKSMEDMFMGLADATE